LRRAESKKCALWLLAYCLALRGVIFEYDRTFIARHVQQEHESRAQKRDMKVDPTRAGR
jgi:hypothetical protein